MKLRLFALILLALTTQTAFAQPVFDYVKRPDVAFAWTKVEEHRLGAHLTITRLAMTSQVWEGVTWKHDIYLLLPDHVDHPDVALFYLADVTPEAPTVDTMGIVATWLSAPVVLLDGVPNEPILGGLWEDSLAAFTFSQYLKTGDASWPLLFPMTKSVLRGMDAVDQYTTGCWAHPLRRFVLTGASKRGWTTWLAAEAAPRRLAGMVPMVYNNLNLPAQMAHQLESWGQYSPMISDYTQRGLPDLVRTPAGRRLATIIDPYTYRQRATVPKLIMAGTNDPYWTLDAASLYFDDLPGPKYLLYMPNSGHGLPNILGVVNAERGFFAAVTGKAPLPRPEWTFERFHDNLLLVMNSAPTPKAVSVWTTTAPTKDFRQAVWTQETLTAHGSRWIGSLRQPATGYAAIFGELIYATTDTDLKVSTEVRIIGSR